MVEPGAIAIQFPEGTRPASAPTVREAPRESQPLIQSPSPPACPAGDASQGPPEGVTEATLMQWRVRAGDPVEEGQELLLVALGDHLHAVTSPVAGTLLVHWSEAGDPIGAGETLGWIRPLTPVLD